MTLNKHIFVFPCIAAAMFLLLPSGYFAYAAVPGIYQISPSAINAGSQDTPITIFGQNLTLNTTVSIDGKNLGVAQAILLPTIISKTIPASYLASSGTHTITVSNEDGQSASATLTVSTGISGGSNPVISSLFPDSKVAGSPGFSLTINGSNFTSASRAYWMGGAIAIQLNATFNSSGQIMASIPAEYLANAGTRFVVVFTPSTSGSSQNSFTNGGVSVPAKFTVTSSGSGANGGVTITSLSQNSVTAGKPGFNLAVNGTNFSESSVVFFKGSGLATTFISPTQLTVFISADNIAFAGTFKVAVNDAFGGTSNTADFTVIEPSSNNPAPHLDSISPNNTIVGTQVTMVAKGIGFVSTSKVYINSLSFTPEFDPDKPDQLTISVPGSITSQEGIFYVMVNNPSPGGGTSNALPFTVTAGNPVPYINSISPDAAKVGSLDTPITIDGGNFINASLVTFICTSSVNPTIIARSESKISFTAPKSMLVSAGICKVFVTNPAPAGGTSDQVTFTVNNISPRIRSLLPDSATAGDPGFTLTINGESFATGAKVKFAGSDRSVSSLSATKITVTITTDDIAAVGEKTVIVTNPSPGGGESNTAYFTVSSQKNPLPVISSISPDSAFVGSKATDVVISGSGFTDLSTVAVNGLNIGGSFDDSTKKITATIPSSYLASTGTLSITVVNPSPGGGTSNAATFTVKNPAPGITSLAPSNVAAGSDGFTLTISGKDFLASSKVTFGGKTLDFSLDSPTSLSVQISSDAVALAKSISVIINNPAPGGGDSNTATFDVTNPAPSLSGISPNVASEGDPDSLLTLTGKNFISSSTVSFAGSTLDKLITQTSTEITVTIPKNLLATAGTYNVFISNPGPGGGNTKSLSFTVKAGPPEPIITGISPSTKIAGEPPFTLTVHGQHFGESSTVSFSGSARPTKFISDIKLETQILAGDIATEGDYKITVSEVENSATLSVVKKNPAPFISSLAPNPVKAGEKDFTLVVTGENFVSGCTATFSGKSRSVAFGNSKEVKVSLTADDVLKAGSYDVIITNPSPGGGSSNAVALLVTPPDWDGPTISSLAPSSRQVTLKTSGDYYTININGTNFDKTSQAIFDGQTATSSLKNEKLLEIAVPMATVQNAGSYLVTVSNAGTSAHPGISNAVAFIVAEYANPVPKLTKLSPDFSLVGREGQLEVTVTGENFLSTSVVYINSLSFGPNVLSDTTMTFWVPPSMFEYPGTLYVIVINPAPGGGTSNALPFKVLSQGNLSITSLKDNWGYYGKEKKIIINGTGFTQDSRPVLLNPDQYTLWQGNPIKLISSNQLQVTVFNNQEASSPRGPYEIAVKNSNNTMSNPMPFHLKNAIDINVTAQDCSVFNSYAFNATYKCVPVTGNYDYTLIGPSLEQNLPVSIDNGSGTYSTRQNGPLEPGTYELRIDNALLNSYADSKCSQATPEPAPFASLQGDNSSNLFWSYVSQAPGKTLLSGTFNQAAKTIENISITPNIHHNTICSITYKKNPPKPGILKIINHTGENDGSFTYAFSSTDTTIAAIPPNRYLSTAEGNGTMEQEIAFSGEYDIAQKSPVAAHEEFSWELISAQCKTENGSNTGSTNLDKKTISKIQVILGQTTTCVVTNAKHPTILKIVENTVGGDETFSYKLNSFPDTIEIKTKNGKGEAEVRPSSPGPHFLKIISPFNWGLASVKCDYPENLAGGGISPETQGLPYEISYKIPIQPGKTITCSIEHVKLGTVNITKKSNGNSGSFTFKIIMPHGPNNLLFKSGLNGYYRDTSSECLKIIGSKNGGSQGVKKCYYQENDFMLAWVDITADDTNGWVTLAGLWPGKYTIKEMGLASDIYYAPGYIMSSPDPKDLKPWAQASSDCENISIAAGQGASCTISNIKVIPKGTLTIEKNTTGPDGSFTYDIYPSPSQMSFATQNNTGSKSIQLNTGTYTVAEQPTNGWIVNSITCRNQTGESVGDVSISGGKVFNINITENQTIICSFKNIKNVCECATPDCGGGDGDGDDTSGGGSSKTKNDIPEPDQPVRTEDAQSTP